MFGPAISWSRLPASGKKAQLISPAGLWEATRRTARSARMTSNDSMAPWEAFKNLRNVQSWHVMTCHDKDDMLWPSCGSYDSLFWGWILDDFGEIQFSLWSRDIHGRSRVQCFKLRLLHQIQHTGKRRGLRYQGAAISCHISFGDPCHLRIKNDRFIYSAISWQGPSTEEWWSDGAQGFGEIGYEWAAEAKAKEYLAKLVLDPVWLLEIWSDFMSRGSFGLWLVICSKNCERSWSRQAQVLFLAFA